MYEISLPINYSRAATDTNATDSNAFNAFKKFFPLQKQDYEWY